MGGGGAPGVGMSGFDVAGARNSTSDSARVQAAGLLLDRGWGKALQPDVGDGGNGSITVVIRQIVDVTGEATPVLIEHDGVCDEA